MENVFDELLDTLESGLDNGMPEQAKLIFLGRIVESVSRGDINNNQAKELERKLNLGNRNQYEDFLAYALSGKPYALMGD